MSATISQRHTLELQRQEKRRFHISLLTVEKAAVIVLLIFVSGGFLHSHWLGLPVMPFQLLIVGIAALSLWKYVPQILQTLVSDPPLTILVIFITMSIFWSINTARTVDELQAFLLNVVIAVYLAMRFNLKDLLQIFIWFSIVMGMLSLATVLAIPEEGIHHAGPHVGLWKGIFIQKNSLARFAALGAVSTIMLGRENLGRWRFFFGGILALLVYGSGSGSGILSMMMMFAVVPMLQVFRLRHQWMVGVLLTLLPVVMVSYFILMGNSEMVLNSVGKDSTLTGRIDLWNASFQLIDERTAFGWGLKGSFAPNSPIQDLVTWSAPFAHNHWIDLTLEIGMIGLLIFSFGLILYFLRAIVHSQREGTVASLFPLVFGMHLQAVLMSTQALITMGDMLMIYYFALVYGLAIYGTRLSNQPYRVGYQMEKRLPKFAADARTRRRIRSTLEMKQLQNPPGSS